MQMRYKLVLCGIIGLTIVVMAPRLLRSLAGEPMVDAVADESAAPETSPTLENESDIAEPVVAEPQQTEPYQRVSQPSSEKKAKRPETFPPKRVFALMPLVYLDVLATKSWTPEEVSAITRLQDEFSQRLDGAYTRLSTDDYGAKWERIREETDEQLQAQLGDELHNELSIEASRQQANER